MLHDDAFHLQLFTAGENVVEVCAVEGRDRCQSVVASLVVAGVVRDVVGNDAVSQELDCIAEPRASVVCLGES